ncbi:MAG: hypothetical protein PHF84_02180, partial [bacterium]|nr:hypothetical protein [bacterium]
MKKNPGVRLMLILLLMAVFFLPLYPTVQWFSMDKALRDKAELKYENIEEYNKLSYEEQKKIDEAKKIKDRSINLG